MNVLAETTPLDWNTPADQYFNYCWWPYEPIAPTAGKLRPSSLLWHSFDLAGIRREAEPFVRALQAEVGEFRTVYGVKWLGNRWAWEFYLYDYERRERRVSLSAVLDLLRNFADVDLVADESIPYFMFSFDLDRALFRRERTLDVAHLYLGNPGSRVSSGIAYELTRQHCRLENFYFFFDAQTMLQDAAAKVMCSAQIDTTNTNVNSILRPELNQCHTICIANKAHHDTAYFSGVNVDQLLFFLNWQQYPARMVEFVVEHRERLDHLLYDVGYDYNRAGTEKSGFYGVV